MKTVLFAISLVLVFLFGLSYEEPKQEQTPSSGDWIGWKNKHNHKPWE